MHATNLPRRDEIKNQPRIQTTSACGLAHKQFALYNSRLYQRNKFVRPKPPIILHFHRLFTLLNCLIHGSHILHALRALGFAECGTIHDEQRTRMCAYLHLPLYAPTQSLSSLTHERHTKTKFRAFAFDECQCREDFCDIYITTLN